jgi:hypothetical protein
MPDNRELQAATDRALRQAQDNDDLLALLLPPIPARRHSALAAEQHRNVDGLLALTVAAPPAAAMAAQSTAATIHMQATGHQEAAVAITVHIARDLALEHHSSHEHHAARRDLALRAHTHPARATQELPPTFPTTSSPTTNQQRAALALRAGLHHEALQCAPGLEQEAEALARHESGLRSGQERVDGRDHSAH